MCVCVCVSVCVCTFTHLLVREREGGCERDIERREKERMGEGGKDRMGEGGKESASSREGRRERETSTLHSFAKTDKHTTHLDKDGGLVHAAEGLHVFDLAKYRTALVHADGKELEQCVVPVCLCVCVCVVVCVCVW